MPKNRAFKNCKSSKTDASKSCSEDPSSILPAFCTMIRKIPYFLYEQCTSSKCYCTFGKTSTLPTLHLSGEECMKVVRVDKLDTSIWSEPEPNSAERRLRSSEASYTTPSHNPVKTHLHLSTLKKPCAPTSSQKCYFIYREAHTKRILCFFVSATHRLPPTARRQPPTNNRLPPAAHHSPPATHHPPQTTHQQSPNTPYTQPQ